MKKTLLFLTLFIFGFSQAQNIFRDDFASYTVNQELNGQGLWTNSSTPPNVGIGSCLPPSTGTCINTQVISQSVSYANFGASTKSISIGPGQDGVARPITPMVTNGDLYVAVVLNIATAPTAAGNPSDFFRVNNGGNGTGSEVAFRMLVRDEGFGYKVGIRKGSSGNLTVFTDEIYNYNESVLFVFKYSHLPGANDDTVKVYVNPVYSATEPLTPAAITSDGFDQSGFIDRFIFRQNYNVVATMPTGFGGLASTSTTWAGLGFLPLSSDSFSTNNSIIFSNNSQVGVLNVNTKSSITNANLNLYSITGSLIDTKTVSIPSGYSEITIPTNLSSGMYIVKLTENSGKTHSQKIIIK